MPQTSQIEPRTIFIALDIETTGFDPEKDQTIEIAAIKFDKKNIYEEFHTLINPRIDIPETITHITGIRQSDVFNAPTFSQIQEKLETFIGEESPIVGHNISFDVNFLIKKGVKIKNELYDTLTLSSILLSKFPSYSLETIASIFGISEKQTHRALDDTRINVKVFQILLEKINEIPEKYQEKIEKILENTDWPLKKFFLNRTPSINTKKGNTEKKEHANNKKTELENNQLLEKFGQALEMHSSLILEAGIKTDKYNALTTAIKSHLNQKGEKILIATFSEEIEKYLHEALPESVLLKNPDRYVSEKRYKIFTEQKTHTHAEIAFMLKILLWIKETETGLVNEITLYGDEFNFWEKINHNEWLYTEENSFAKKALDRVKNAKIIITHQRKLAEILFTPENSTKNLINFDHLIILEGDHLETELQEALTSIYTLKNIERKIPEEFKNPFIIFFGLLGIFYEKYLRDTDHEIVPHVLKETPEWSRIKDAFQKIWDAVASDEIKNFLSPLYSLFLDEKNSYIFLTQNADGDIFLKYMPFQKMQQIWKHPFFQKEKSLILISETLRIQKSFNFIRSRLQLNKEIEELYLPPAKSILEKIKIIIPKKFPEPNEEQHFIESTKLMKKIILETPGKTIALFPAKKTVHAIYYKLNEPLKEKGFSIICQDFSGGRGKMIERYRKNPQQSALTGTFHFLEKAKLSLLPCENFIIGKIPFDAPNDPSIAIRCRGSLDPFNEYSIPNTMLRLLNIFNAFFRSSGETKTIYLLDNRIFKKNYGKIFLESLPEGIKIQAEF